MRSLIVFGSLFFCIIAAAHAQKMQENRFRIVFYNIENLFDTIDDPVKSDEDFLPSAKIAWTSQRYEQKLKSISRVLTAIDSIHLPTVIGFAEVENIGVLQDLIDKTGLSGGNYAAILEEGNDPRGIDVALIYRKNLLKYIDHRSFPGARSFKTRSLLYVRLASARQDTFHIFVNHWKSRSGGATETEPQRLENAGILKHYADSLLARNPGSRVIMMGDFNDEPNNKSLAEVLGAVKPGKKINPSGLYNLMYEPFLRGEGTLYYKDWDVFDQFIVSGSLLKKKAIGFTVTGPPYAFIFKEEWMLYKNKDGKMVPNRTAGSREYFGGYSDHLPVYIDVASDN